MDYPIWYTPWLGGASLIAIIATLHVFIAHFAVGGGLYLVTTDALAQKTRSAALLQHVRAHTKFFLLLTMVFGGLSGAAIWFIISTVSPRATSTLIHAFVFGWATEWVFFLGEIVTLYVYYYWFNRMDPKRRLGVGWAYAFFGFMSLFVINGVIGFMLTPGDWLADRDFWSGFFNPSFWPQLALRFMLALSLAGAFAAITAARMIDDAARKIALARAGRWAGLPVFGAVASGFWYVQALPPAQRDMVLRKSAEIPGYIVVFLASAAILAPLGVVVARSAASKARTALALLPALVGLGLIGGFEFIRESARRPYIIHDYYYSTSMSPAETAKIGKDGILPVAKWSRVKDLKDPVKAGEALFALQCHACHSINGFMNDVAKNGRHLTRDGVDAQLTGQGRLYGYMPPFVGNAKERAVLATWLAETVSGRAKVKESPPSYPNRDVEPAAFNATTSDYALIAWSSRGLNHWQGEGEKLRFSNPDPELRAFLVKREDSPSRVADAIIEHHFLDPNQGAPGTLKPGQNAGEYAGVAIPKSLSGEDGKPSPFPVMEVTAKNAQGVELARTRTVLPLSNAWGCGNCHAGGPAINTGIDPKAAKSTLALHDKRHKTRLVAQSGWAGEVRCGDCHGRDGRPDLSTALHGFHANYLTGAGPDACTRCHVGRTAPRARDFHSSNFGFGCADCHGSMEEHALSLLNQTKAAGGKDGSKDGAKIPDRLGKNLVVKTAVQARKPWDAQPGCQSCHAVLAGKNDAKYSDGKPESLYRNKRDEFGAVPCAACHGPAHAVFPSSNPYGERLDNLAPLQYQGVAKSLGAEKNCTVCHRAGADMFLHHPLPEK